MAGVDGHSRKLHVPVQAARGRVVVVTSGFEVRERVDAVRARIRSAGGDPDRVRLVAVTKGFGVDVVRAALEAGLTDLGESYAQELVAKATDLSRETASSDAGLPRPRWHFIGRLQRNKIRKVAPYVSEWQSVERLEIGREIARRAPGATVLVQVNVSGERTKAGCAPGELPALLHGLRDLDLDVRGLMTIAPYGPPEEQAAPVFDELRRLADRYDLPERSMGMSHDLEVAIAHGATTVRLGSALFGPRPDQPVVQN
jgi:PLP dependent protein